MLSSYKKTTSIYAVSEIDNMNAVVFSGTIETNGKYNVLKSVQDVQLYNENKQECDKDYNEFEQRVQEEAGKE